MKITVLTDNKAQKGFRSEWGLSFYIEHEGRKLLLDTGASSLFAENAQKCNIDLSCIDSAFLSHAHYDHSNGFGEFFQINKTAPLYLNKNCKENCYGKRWIFSRYIGIKKGYSEKYKDRFIYNEDITEFEKGIFLLPHIGKEYSAYGKKNGLFQKINKKWHYDSFNHEQSLILKSEKGLVIFNSCCHAGADNIINEVAQAFKGEKIHTIIGGFHLYKSGNSDVLELCKKISETGIEKIYTGHCTGDKAFAVLKNQLGDKVHGLYAGMEIEI